jgi:serine/threonine protein kinase
VEAIESLHEIGFIHNDIKPSNIMVGKQNLNNEKLKIFIVDFGLCHQYIKRWDYFQGLLEDAQQLSFAERELFAQNVVKKYHHKDYFGKYEPQKAFRGNLMYQSKYIFEGHAPSRRDDIISIIYLLICLCSPSLPSIPNDFDFDY